MLSTSSFSCRTRGSTKVRIRGRSESGHQFNDGASVFLFFLGLIIANFRTDQAYERALSHEVGL
jgi:hypothetical protein